MTKVQTVGSIREFLHPSVKELKVQDVVNVMNDPKVKVGLTGSVVVTLMNSGMKVFAQPEAVPVLADGIKNQIMHAFDPLINLVQILAYPIAFVMISGGCLFIMCGNREKGMSMIQTACIGYILCQLAPLFMKILVGIGSAV